MLCLQRPAISRLPLIRCASDRLRLKFAAEAAQALVNADVSEDEDDDDAVADEELLAALESR